MDRQKLADGIMKVVLVEALVILPTAIGAPAARAASGIGGFRCPGR